MDLFVRILPEWAPPNRSRPQRNAYHQFTVDRHLCEAAALAADLVDRVDRPDLLVLGALLHDIGKGYPGDHTEVGMELVADIAHPDGLPAHRRGHPRGNGGAPSAAARRGHPARSRGPRQPSPRWPARPAPSETLRLLGALTEARLGGHRPVGVEQMEGQPGPGVGGPLRPRHGGGRLGRDHVTVPHPRAPPDDGGRRAPGAGGGGHPCGDRPRPARHVLPGGRGAGR